jgi:hypothetical protein
VQQMIRNDGGTGQYQELVLPMLGLWNTLLRVSWLAGKGAGWLGRDAAEGMPVFVGRAADGVPLSQQERRVKLAGRRPVARGSRLGRGRMQQCCPAPQAPCPLPQSTRLPASGG